MYTCIYIYIYMYMYVYIYIYSNHNGDSNNNTTNSNYTVTIIITVTMIPSTIIITTILEYQYGLENGCWVDPCVGLFAEPKNRETATLIAKLG